MNDMAARSPTLEPFPLPPRMGAAFVRHKCTVGHYVPVWADLAVSGWPLPATVCARVMATGERDIKCNYVKKLQTSAKVMHMVIPVPRVFAAFARGNRRRLVTFTRARLFVSISRMTSC